MKFNPKYSNKKLNELLNRHGAITQRYKANDYKNGFLVDSCNEVVADLKPDISLKNLTISKQNVWTIQFELDSIKLRGRHE